MEYTPNIRPNYSSYTRIIEDAVGDMCLLGASRNAREFMASPNAKGDYQQADLLKRWFPVKYRLMVARAYWRTLVGAIRYMRKWAFMYRGKEKELAEQASAQAAYETAAWVDSECQRMVETLSPANKEKFEQEFEALAA